MEQNNNQKIGPAAGPKNPAWLVKPVGEICVARFSDNDLYQKCREYGMNAKLWSRKFAGLLPEVAKRNLHRRKGFISIQEFAGKLAGMSEYAVDRILNIAKNLENKPALMKLFESGAEGWSKIATVAYVSTKETDEFWAEKLRLLSKPALALLVQNYRRKFVPGDESQMLSKTSQVDELVRFSFPASREVEFDLRLAKQKLEKQSKQALSWNEAFQMLIQKSEFAGGQVSESTMVVATRKYSGFCTKCRKRAQIQNVQVCDECAKREFQGRSE